MSDVQDRRTRRRARWAVALLIIGLLGAVVPALAAGSGFLPIEHIYRVEGSRLIPLSSPGSAGPAPMECRISGDVLATGVNAAGLTVRGSGEAKIMYIAPWTSAVYLVQHDAGWAAAAAAIALAPLLFLWWRRAAVSFVRVAGLACCVAAGASVCAIVLLGQDEGSHVVGGTWWTVPVGAAVMAAAFLVAPTPRRRDDG
jgi:hypothetical protein